MEKRDRADELISTLPQLGPLEDVPVGVSNRFHKTLAQLAKEETSAKAKSKWFSNSNQFALAASFVLIFALGAVVTLNSGEKANDPLGVAKPQSTQSPSKSDTTDDQLQYAGGDKSMPEVLDSPIKLSSSLHDYVEIPRGFAKKIGAEVTWNSTKNLDAKSLACLKKLELTDSTNLIDDGKFQGSQIKAIWSPETRSSWNVYLVSSSCIAIDKKFVQE